MVTGIEALLDARPALRALVAVLDGPDATRIVGGAVRDTLAGGRPSDVDLATRLLPDTVMARLAAAAIKAVPTGLSHGTVTAVTGEGPVEVTTLRRDVATDGRRAEVAFTDDWHEDAARRDFTINALYADAETGAVVDFFGGIDDLAARRVRFIGDPLRRIAEDHLRILRFFRFHQRYGGPVPDADGLAACTARANDLMALSRERIASELLKMLETANPARVFETMIAHGILAPIVPEFESAEPLRRCALNEAELGVAPDAVRHMAALIDGRADLAKALGGRLKLSNAQAKRLVAACTVVAGTPQAIAYRKGIHEAVDQLVLSGASAGELVVLNGWVRPQLPISGGALIARGLEAGPVVAATLAAIETSWVDTGFPGGLAFDALVDDALNRAR